MSIFTSNIELSSDNYPTIRPTLDLNFAATKTLDRRITFTRDSVGTFTDENGMVKYASNNVPRFDHDPTTGESLGLLIEESRTNILYGTPSQSNTINSYNQYNSLTGKYDATKLAKNAPGSSQSHGDWNWSGNLSTTSFVMSIFVKKINHASFFIQMISSGAGTNLYIYYNIDTKVTSIVDNGSSTDPTVTRSIENYGDGWFRLVARVEGFSNTALHSGIRFGFASGGSDTQQYQDTSDEVLIYGAQAEVGNFVTSYIPTHESTTSVTRAQDNAKITGTNFTDFYNQEEGTLVLSADIGYLATSNQAAVVFEDTSSQSTDLIALGYRVGGGASGGLGGWYQGNGASVTYQHHSVGVTANSEFRQALAYKTDDLASVANGTTPLTDNSGTLSTSIDRVRFGEYYADGMTSGHIRQFKYYNKRLPDAQLQGLTQQ